MEHLFGTLELLLILPWPHGCGALYAYRLCHVLVVELHHCHGAPDFLQTHRPSLTSPWPSSRSGPTLTSYKVRRRAARGTAPLAPIPLSGGPPHLPPLSIFPQKRVGSWTVKIAHHDATRASRFQGLFLVKKILAEVLRNCANVARPSLTLLPLCQTVKAPLSFIWLHRRQHASSTWS